MKPRLIHLTTAVALMFAWSTAVFPLTQIDRPFSQLVDLADIILVGTVNDTSAEWGQGQFANTIFTVVTLDNLDVIKGNVQGATYGLRYAGGRIGDLIHSYEGTPSLTVGTRYVLFISSATNVLFPIVGIGQGVFIVTQYSGGATETIQTVGGRDVLGLLGDHIRTTGDGGPVTFDQFVSDIENQMMGVLPEVCPAVGFTPPVTVLEEYVVMDFEDSVLHTREWLKTQPDGTIAPTVLCKSDSGCNNLSLDVGGGRNGGNALLVTSNNVNGGLPGFWIIKYQARNGDWAHVEDEDVYALPRGRRANRLEFWIRSEKGFRASQSSAPCANDTCYPNHQNFHVGTYHFDPAEFPTGEDGEYESHNWHYYYQIHFRHDKANDEWIHVILNQWPQLQRDEGVTQKWNNPTKNDPRYPVGNFWELLTRIYLENVGYFVDPEIPYPVRMWIDDVRLIYVDEGSIPATPINPDAACPAISASDQNVEKRWEQHLHGPFDAVIK